MRMSKRLFVIALCLAASACDQSRPTSRHSSIFPDKLIKSAHWQFSDVMWGLYRERWLSLALATDAPPAPSGSSAPTAMTSQVQEVAFHFFCSPESEQVRLTSMVVTEREARLEGWAQKPATIWLFSGDWGRRIVFRPPPTDRGLPNLMWTGSVDDPVLVAFADTGQLRQTGSRSMDLSARTAAERVAIRRFFESCRSRELRSLDPLRAVAAARKAIAQGDFRFLAVANSAHVPGLDAAMVTRLDSSKIRVIPGTGDTGNEFLNRNATAYATAYNLELLKRGRQ